MKRWVILLVVAMLVVALVGVVVLSLVEPRIAMAGYNTFLRTQLQDRTAFVDKAVEFPESAFLEEHWEEIRDEMQAVLASGDRIPSFQEVDKGQRLITKDDQWKTFVLLGYGNPVHANVARCPKTWALLQQCPRVSSAMFSILAPGKRIKPHVGPTNAVLRYHLGLQIPKEGECYIIVDGERYDWKEGEGVMFDDTYRHSVWNNTKERRVVLFLDVARQFPQKPALERMNQRVLRYVQKSKRVQKACAKAEVQRSTTTA